MAVVSIEMTPQEFPIVNSNGVFAVNDVVKIQGPKSDFVGVVRAVNQKNFGSPPVPGLALGIAITRGDLSEFRNGGFAGYSVTSNAGAQGTVRTPCLLKYQGRLMKSAELQKMLDAAERLIARAARYKSDGYARQWFGAKALDNKLELAKIHRRCADLAANVAALSTVVFQCAASEILGAISTTDPLRGGPTCRIQLGRGFTYDRYSWGERVCTIVHEMTHWFLGTVDVTMDNGSDCYGAACLRLAESDTEYAKALNNADNWAYYICQYRTDEEAGDWRNFTEAEITARGSFVPNGYNVVQSLIARYN